MSLSSYFDWGTDVQDVNTEPIYQSEPLQTPQLVAGDDEYQYQQHLQHYSETSYELPNYAFLDPYVDLNNNILPYFFSSPPYEYKIPYDQNSSSYDQYPKRQKLIEDHRCCSSDFVMPVFFDGAAPNFSPMPEGHQSMNRVNNVKKMSSEKSVSSQSIAARERRRKITEKTQELGKLVPGGNKMNTAEMLQAAFKYIKFMQAQLQVVHGKRGHQITKHGNGDISEGSRKALHIHGRQVFGDAA